MEGGLHARVRRTGTDEAEPLADGPERPRDAPRFRSNPVFAQGR
ncbi:MULTISPECIES: hypothetical protein [unclassified Streptomyces]|nr:hypothetical protein [Streptomyces sp. CB02058]